MFDELLARLKDKVAKEEKRKRRAREDFTALLKDIRDIKVDMSWEDAQPLLQKQPEYKGVSRARPYEPLVCSAITWLISDVSGTMHMHTPRDGLQCASPLWSLHVSGGSK